MQLTFPAIDFVNATKPALFYLEKGNFGKAEMLDKVTIQEDLREKGKNRYAIYACDVHKLWVCPIQEISKNHDELIERINIKPYDLADFLKSMPKRIKDSDTVVITQSSEDTGEIAYVGSNTIKMNFHIFDSDCFDFSSLIERHCNGDSYEGSDSLNLKLTDIEALTKGFKANKTEKTKYNEGEPILDMQRTKDGNCLLVWNSEDEREMNDKPIVFIMVVKHIKKED